MSLCNAHRRGKPDTTYQIDEEECPWCAYEEGVHGECGKLWPDRISVEIVQGVGGLALVVNDRRIAGPKPWAGGKVTRRWLVKVADLIEAMGQKEPTE